MIICYVCKTKMKNEQAKSQKHADGKIVNVCIDCFVEDSVVKTLKEQARPNYQVDYFR